MSITLLAWGLSHIKCFMAAILRNVGYLSMIVKNKCTHLKFSSNISQTRFMDVQPV